jgi:hypothetical protein
MGPVSLLKTAEMNTADMAEPVTLDMAELVVPVRQTARHRTAA